MSDGPENVAIKAKNQVMVGQSVQITCSYASFPVPTFTWKFNDSIMHGEEKECLEIPNFQDKNGGIYTCEAFNSITGLKKSATYNLMVKGKDHTQIYCVAIHIHTSKCIFDLVAIQVWWCYK